MKPQPKDIFKRPKQKRSKYGNKRTKYNGYHYDSAKEASYAEELDWRKKAGEIKKVINQKSLTIRVNGIYICKYKIDFKVILSDDSEEYVEVKGFETRDWKIKWELTKAIFDEPEFRTENNIGEKAKLLLIK